jgi:hypothetical protein
MEAQKLWNFSTRHTGPVRRGMRYAVFAVRRDFYEQAEWKSRRSDPEADPFADAEKSHLSARLDGWGVPEMAFIIRVMTLDTHEELVGAWRVINAASEQCRTEALAQLQDLGVGVVRNSDCLFFLD